MTEKVVLVTGASGGAGRHIAGTLAKHGFRVFGTSRNPKNDTLDGFAMLPLDVTDDDSVANCVTRVIEQAGRIDVLVNNAGIELLGAIEETSIDEAKKVFETNFFGVARMNNAVLPHMRQQRSGMIITLSSVAGLAAGAFQGYYCASKHAIEGYHEALLLELEPFNIQVKLIEPGIFKSGIAANRVDPVNKIADYDEARDKATDTWVRYIENDKMPVEKVANTALHIAQGKSRKMRHVVSTPDLYLNIFAKASPETPVNLYRRLWCGLGWGKQKFKPPA